MPSAAIRNADVDAAVVGAGPAGARTAAQLAARGFRVLILERDPEPGRPVHCTGIVSSECVERFALPRSLVLHEIDSFVLHSPKGASARVKRPSTQAYVLDRVGLDKHLVRKAEEAGAEVLAGVAVNEVTWTGAGVCVEGTLGGEPLRVEARAAVIATGFGAPLARRLGLGEAREVLSGCQVVAEAQGLSQVEVYSGGAHGRGGFGWLVPYRPGYALAGVLTRSHAVRYMREHVRRLQAAGRVGAVVETFRCRPVPLGVAGSSVADGVVGVGDVVNQVKPTTGGGIYYGLLGADAAADTLAEALERGRVDEAALLPYEARWRGLMASEIRRGYQLRRLLEGLPDAGVEQMHRLLRLPGLQRAAVSMAAPFDWHSGPLLRFMDKLQRYAEPAV